MSNGIIENAEELKSWYLQTDITDIAAVQSAIKEISENVHVAGKEKYLEALNAATPENISKARRYDNTSIYIRYLGWGLIAVFCVLAGIFDDSGLFEESTVTWPYVGAWIGIGLQIYMAVIKSAWNKLTLSGAVIHPAIKSISVPLPIGNQQPVTGDVPSTVKQMEATKPIFCSKCGHKNTEGAQFCENCGTKL